MLQQILQQMHVDPELLEKLSDDDRHNLFGKMREEQVRRWTVWQEDVERQEERSRNKPRLPPKPKKKKKKVHFMLGSDGNPWTWVIDDGDVVVVPLQLPSPSLSKLSPTQNSANSAPETGGGGGTQLYQVSPAGSPCQLLKCHTKDVTDVRGNVNAINSMSPTVDAYADADADVTSTSSTSFLNMDADESDDQEVRATLSRARLLARILEQNSVDNERSSWLKRRQDRDKIAMTTTTVHVTRALSPTRSQTVTDGHCGLGATAEPANSLSAVAAIRAKKVETDSIGNSNATSTIERNLAKSNIDDVTDKDDVVAGTVKSAVSNRFKEIARHAATTLSGTYSMSSSSSSAAAAKNRRNNVVSNFVSPRLSSLPITRTRNRPPKPPSREALAEWFRAEERVRGTGWDAERRCVEPWFHGMVSRQEAEDTLADQPKGTFLVRFCERIWGYAVSYRGAEKCKHYLIDASNDHYRFLGEGFKRFKKFGDLVRFYQSRSFVPNDHECLSRPCPKTTTDNERILSELFSSL